MKKLFIDKKFEYDGTQLHSLFAYLNHGVLGNSIVSWIGPCQISLDHMVDGEDLLAEETICGDEMLHFVIEVFDRDLFAAVSLQRMFTSIAKDYLQQAASQKLKQKFLVRSGDDIYLEKKKLSISIATKSPVSSMIHFAMNVTNAGTPVKTLALQEDLGLKPKTVAQDLMRLFVDELNSMTEATQKVKPIK